MVFGSLSFLFLFLSTVLGLYFLNDQRLSRVTMRTTCASAMPQPREG